MKKKRHSLLARASAYYRLAAKALKANQFQQSDTYRNDVHDP